MHDSLLSLHARGEHDRAGELDRDALARCRRLHGPDHPETLRLATNYAVYLLGEEHPDTLATARNLAIDLAALAGQGDPPAPAGPPARRGAGPPTTCAPSGRAPAPGLRQPDSPRWGCIAGGRPPHLRWVRGPADAAPLTHRMDHGCRTSATS